MTQSVSGTGGRDGAPNSHRPPFGTKPGFKLTGSAFSALSLAGAMIIIIAASILSGVIYHYSAYGTVGRVIDFFEVGLLAALAYVMLAAYRGQRRLQGLMSQRRAVRRAAINWTYAFLALLVVAFLTKTSSAYSRGALLIFYATGLVGLVVLQVVISAVLQAALASGYVKRRRVMLIGTSDEHHAFAQGDDRAWRGFRIVKRAHLPAYGAAASLVEETLSRHARKARRLMLDDVVILTPLSEPLRIQRCVDAFTMLPVSIHVSTGHLLDRFSRVEMSRVGAISALALTAPPLTPLQAALKRMLDISAALVGLILLAPLFAVIALLIKRDSPGPVFFRQRRLGFNQRTFHIIKFRSMTSVDDGDTIVQAKVGDKRITKIGAWLRATNIDELPQLINVLRGEMSVIGPRPDAIAHDRDYEKRITRYPRRLNVRPGITGWAQVNGWRGETETDEKMAKRVEHDLYYIDHWSPGFDLYILLLTLFSRRAYRNAR